MSKKIEEPVRINIRIPVEVNEWLDNESKRTAIPKSSLVFIAVQKYIDDKEQKKIERFIKNGKI